MHARLRLEHARAYRSGITDGYIGNNERRCIVVYDAWNVDGIDPNDAEYSRAASGAYRDRSA